jgi:FkbM family methyltransferase
VRKDIKAPAEGSTPAPAPLGREGSSARRFVKALFNVPGIERMLGWCGLRGVLWRIYCRWFGPSGGIMQLQLGAQHARFYVHTDWTAAYLRSFGSEQELLERLVSIVKPGDVVYDIGANMGLHAVFLAQAVGGQGQIIAFEPELHYCERLRGNAALNDVRNIRVRSEALGDHACELELLPSEPGKAAPRLADHSPDARGGRAGSKVQVVEGDRLVETENLPLPRLVKIDVEGFEYAVLRGLRRTLSNSLCQIVCCEVHLRLLPEGVGQGEILDFLKSCGYSRFDVCPRPPDQHILAFKE